MTRMSEVHALLNVEQATKRAATLPFPSRDRVYDAIVLILGKINDPSMTRMDVIRMFRGDSRLIFAVGAEVRMMEVVAELPAKREADEAMAAIGEKAPKDVSMREIADAVERWIAANHK